METLAVSVAWCLIVFAAGLVVWHPRFVSIIDKRRLFSNYELLTMMGILLVFTVTSQFVVGKLMNFIAWG